MHRSRVRSACRVAGLCCAAMLVGCGGSTEPKAPFETVEVRGEVVYADGRDVAALDRAKVWFQSKANPAIQALGAISDDGSFIMTVLTKDQTWAGVPEGEYRVRIEPPQEDDTRTALLGIVHPKYQAFATSGLSVRIPLEGQLKFTLDPPARGGS